MKRTVLTFVLLLCGPLSGHAQSALEWSIWKNQRGSLLVITNVKASGNFDGTFVSKADGFLCKGIPANISGSIQNNAVTFAANFAPCHNTITVWKGTLNGNVIATDWDLWFVDDKNNFQELKDQDTFTKIN